MSLTMSAPIFPGFQPGQTFTPPGTPIRAPQWNYKVSDQYQNFRNRSVNGITRTVEYWPNPLRLFEWTYGYIYDDPTGVMANLGAASTFYAQPIPATDFQMLRSFWNGMKGGGNVFLFQPPDSVVGGNATINAVAGTGNFWTLYFTTSPLFALGLYAYISGLSTATWLNGQTLEILGVTPNSITVYFAHGNLAKTADAGSVFVGQQLAAVDANLNTELVHQIGSYPTLPLAGAPYPFTQVTESVQVIDSSSLYVIANGASVAPTLEPVDTIAPYPGLELTFGSSPATPILAQFNYWYPCLFSEDTQQWENFMTMLWMASAVKFEQQRL